jgi:hypothetical protein
MTEDTEGFLAPIDMDRILEFLHDYYRPRTATIILCHPPLCSGPGVVSFLRDHEAVSLLNMWKHVSPLVTHAELRTQNRQTQLHELSEKLFAELVRSITKDMHALGAKRTKQVNRSFTPSPAKKAHPPDRVLSRPAKVQDGSIIMYQGVSKSFRGKRFKGFA